MEKNADARKIYILYSFAAESLPEPKYLHNVYKRTCLFYQTSFTENLETKVLLNFQILFSQKLSMY